MLTKSSPFAPVAPLRALRETFPKTRSSQIVFPLSPPRPLPEILPTNTEAQTITKNLVRATWRLVVQIQAESPMKKMIAGFLPAIAELNPVLFSDPCRMVNNSNWPN